MNKKKFEPEVEIVLGKDGKAFAEAVKEYLIKLSKEKPTRKIDFMQYATPGYGKHSLIIIHSKK